MCPRNVTNCFPSYTLLHRKAVIVSHEKFESTGTNRLKRLKYQFKIDV